MVIGRWGRSAGGEVGLGGKLLDCWASRRHTPAELKQRKGTATELNCDERDLTMTQQQPPTLSYATPDKTAGLRDVALAQRGVIYCLLFNLIAIGVDLAIDLAAQDDLVILLGYLALRLTLLIATLIFSFRLTRLVYGMGIAILMLFLLLIPVVGVIALLVINHRAITILRRGNVRVGFMGVAKADLPAR